LMWLEACGVEEAENGFSAYVGGERIAVFCTAGESGRKEIHAVSDVCTHAGASLSEGGVRNGVVRCPRHGAPFDVRTGESVGPPASEDLRVYETKVKDGAVYVRINDG
jgi:3-phenylpropionate/trans-cinnamate dioxygenase ferredoxin subunit